MVDGQCSTDSMLPTWTLFGLGSLVVTAAIYCIVQGTLAVMDQIKSAAEAEANGIAKVDNFVINIHPVAETAGMESVSGTKGTELKTWDDMAWSAKAYAIGMDFHSRKGIYVSAALHLIDTVSDYASLVEFGTIAYTSSTEDCRGLNMKIVFCVSTISLILYRVVATYKLRELSQIVDGFQASKYRLLGQLLDVELWRILMLSHRTGLKGSSSPQRLLQVLEAILEASPQAVLQLTYLAHLGTGSWVVIGSALFSMMTLTTTIAGDDALVAWQLLRNKVYEKMTAEGKPDAFKSGVRYANQHAYWMQPFFYLLRMMEVPSKLLLFALLWTKSGFIVSVGVGVNLSLAAMVYFYLKYFDKVWGDHGWSNPPPIDIILLPVASPLFLGRERRCISSFVWMWCMCDSATMVTLFWMLHPEVGDGASWIYIASLFATVGAGVKVIMLIGWWWFVWDIKKEMPIKEKSDLSALLLFSDWTNALELIIFCCENLEDAVKQRYSNGIAGQEWSFLYIATRVPNKRLVDSVWKVSSDADRRQADLTARPKRWNPDGAWNANGCWE